MARILRVLWSLGIVGLTLIDVRMNSGTDRVLLVPGEHFSYVALAIGLAIAPWFVGNPIPAFSQWRFSLRTLLIATTLVAVALGFVVWLAL